ncbi:hypothetical protein Sros01_62810 [Streptomyces roseochromogenus]|nr:hypothetical protein Sros01_62810 [Streptomyces roseochromogenus]
MLTAGTWQLWHIFGTAPREGLPGASAGPHPPVGPVRRPGGAAGAARGPAPHPAARPVRTSPGPRTDLARTPSPPPRTTCFPYLPNARFPPYRSDWRQSSKGFRRVPLPVNDGATTAGRTGRPPGHTIGGAPSSGRPGTPGRRCHGNGPAGGR